ncbi:hypothetical protein AAMO2058_000366300 [Amorphochlora amoebiformis]|mmetsp:Transcript_33053/g.53101  ORF Transcript_33053/g.53101 Transcript_33053/m.53101 type:complete len:388 (-) Transcript_33053:227-1390(-)|eukprot:1394434-Amorphochlora_amoeboformis.AAC.1
MPERVVKLILGNGHVRRFKMKLPIGYKPLRREIAKVCKAMGAEYDIFHMTLNDLLPVENEADVERSLNYRPLDFKSGSEKLPAIRLVIRRVFRHPPTSTPVVVNQPSSTDDQPTTTTPIGTRATEEKHQYGDCLSDPCPPSTREPDDDQQDDMIDPAAPIRNDTEASIRDESMLVCREDPGRGGGGGNILEVSTVLEKLDSKLGQITTELEYSISELKDGKSQDAAATTASNLAQVARNLKEMRIYTQKVATQVKVHDSAIQSVIQSISMHEESGIGVEVDPIVVVSPPTPVVTVKSHEIKRVEDPEPRKSERVQEDMKASTGFVDLQRSIGEVRGRNFDKELEQLAERGWSDSNDLNFKKILLKIHNGDIDKVIEDLKDYRKVGTA